MRACVIRTPETAGFLRIDRRIDACRFSHMCRREPDAAQRRCRPAAARQFVPGCAAIRRFVDRAARSRDGREIALPGILMRFPGARENQFRICGIARDVDHAGPVIDLQHLRPGLTAVRRTIEAAVGAGPEKMPLRADKHDVLVFGIDPDAADITCVGETQRCPMCAAVGRLENAEPRGDVVARLRLAGTDIESVRVRRRDGERADRGGRAVLKLRLPGLARIVRLPDAAAGPAEIEGVGLRRHAFHRRRPTAAKRPELAPMEIAREIRAVLRLRKGGREKKERCAAKKSDDHRPTACVTARTLALSGT